MSPVGMMFPGADVVADERSVEASSTQRAAPTGAFPVATLVIVALIAGWFLIRGVTQD